uniref:Uncharacterized protein n=1 Tax=Zea mays TaxID=4577 RepID=B4FGL1_MAIZE|nr:unknown [Zea mays]
MCGDIRCNRIFLRPVRGCLMKAFCTVVRNPLLPEPVASVRSGKLARMTLLSVLVASSASCVDI